MSESRRYFVSAADESAAADCSDLLEDHGYQVVPEYDDDAIVISLGGDGSILYNSRRYGEPTILPVAGPGSEANRIEVNEDDLVERVADIEDGSRGTNYRIDAHRKLVATRDGAPIGGNGNGDFSGLNDVHLHHSNPVRAAKFTTRITDTASDANDERDCPSRVVYESDHVIGDGLLVATPFGSTGYYRSITGGVIETGLGVAFNNVHKPADAPLSFGLSANARVECELLTTTRSASAVLARDDDTDVRELDPGESVSISLSDRTVEIVRFAD